eukprot:418842_1
MGSINGSVPDRVGEILSPFSPCPSGVMDLVQGLLCIEEDDIVMDIGSGDGRVLIKTCGKSRARGIGIEYDVSLIQKAKAAIMEAGIEKGRLTIIHASADSEVCADILKEVATCVFIYLVPKGVNAIAEKLIEFHKQGGRIVSYIFSIPGLTASRVEIFKSTKIYVYGP